MKFNFATETEILRESLVAQSGHFLSLLQRIQQKSAIQCNISLVLKHFIAIALEFDKTKPHVHFCFIVLVTRGLSSYNLRTTKCWTV